MIKSFSGGAGCGKTWSLMQEVQLFVAGAGLDDGHKILALTYMQGARKRLEDSLRSLPGLKGRYVCETLDSFARHVITRWTALRQHLELELPDDEDFERACEVAATLLERSEVIEWVHRGFRLLVIDEAQDMDSVRLRVVQALSSRIDTLIAADEFQCLNEELADNPLCGWLKTVTNDEELVIQRRTGDVEILAAAAALRAGAPIPNGKRTYRMLVTGSASKTADQVNNWISWYARAPASTAILSPSISPYVRKVIELVRTTKSAKRNLGPHRVKLESSDSKRLEDLIDQLKLPEVSDDYQILESVSTLQNPIFALSVSEWLDRQRRTRNKRSFLRDEVLMEVRSIISRQRRGRGDRPGGVRAMTVHGAKNREFDVVIILWPTGMKWSPEHQRRLLYNAVTRSKRMCVVLLQTGKVLKAPPFV